MLLEYADRGSLEEAIQAKRFQRRSDKSQLDMVQALHHFKRSSEQACAACAVGPSRHHCLPACTTAQARRMLSHYI